ncbi:RNA binding motif protein 12Ba [Denticeps clupeoides]|uniref:RNA-binding protein 12B-like n=1 Tax=Denticeps clupeoides TaxID=299321 RepID=UPI0010A4182E|nr:RNA-binding protein 12B-like [Denticeps clupeoides]XP_028836344.1 RNA-binding protein 12B-like [Denticeps clupeoides]XP_028836542.1 RNA-binding protein 12B-like [Denticeps clupeoides]XP_028836543.1 RNA-binding protein 12B-like [Denticeps clupeoides]
MTIVLRLQGLNVDAGVEDIRRFFDGLTIPKGALHITGGDLGEAFILFSSEKDGQLAMRRSGGVLRGSKVTLHISSVAELKRQLAAHLQPQRAAEPAEQTLAALQKCPEGVMVLGVLAAVVQGLQASNQAAPGAATGSRAASPVSPRGPRGGQTPVGGPVREGDPKAGGPGFLRLYGLPSTATKVDVSGFLEGLHVTEAIVNARLGDRRGCLVKVAGEAEVEEGLRFSGRSMGTVPVEVRRATAEQWVYAVKECERVLQNTPSVVPHDAASRSSGKRSSKERSLSPKRRRVPSGGTEHCVMVQNLKANVTKTDLKTIFSCPHLPNNRVLHLLKNGMRTTTAFLNFDCAEDYVAAMNLSGTRVGNQVLDVSSITKEKMLKMTVHRGSDSALTCVYVRNLPADVTQAQVRDFFCQFPVEEGHVSLLRDKEGRGLGEAVVSFGSVVAAQRARKLHNQTFMGNKMLLTCISTRQLSIMLHQSG